MNKKTLLNFLSESEFEYLEILSEFEELDMLSIKETGKNTLDTLQYNVTLDYLYKIVDTSKKEKEVISALLKIGLMGGSAANSFLATRSVGYMDSNKRSLYNAALYAQYRISESLKN